MSIDAIKELIRKGDIPQAGERLREILAKTPEDAAARMLYGTCCQLMGDSATFGRIYRDLAPEMEPRVTSGERSELVSMWLKYAAMFAVVLTCFYGALGEDVAPEISNATNAMEVVSVANTDDLYDRVMKMSQRDRMVYFVSRPEVKRELLKGDVRAIVIQLNIAKNPVEDEDDDEDEDEDEKKDDRKKSENIMLISASSSLKTGADVFKALVEAGNTDKFMLVQKGQTNNRISDFCAVYESGSSEYRAKDKTFQILEEHGDISDLIISLAEQGAHVLGLCYVNFYPSARRLAARYAVPRDFGARFPKYVIAPDGKVLYELTEKVRVEPRTAYGGPRYEKPPRPQTKYGGPKCFDEADF